MQKSNNLETVYSEKGKLLILYQGYKFYKAYEGIQGNSWRCVQKKCPAKLLLNDCNSTILKENTTHNHEKSQNLGREIVSNSLKRKAADDLMQKPRKVVVKEIEMEETRKYSDNFTAKDVKCLTLNLYRAKRKRLPRLPKSQQEVHEALNQINVISHKGENMIKVNDSEKNIICFTTDTNLAYLSKKSKLFGDGTFTYSPKYFHQLFTIHTVENGNYIPLVFFLLPNKTSGTYENMFELLKELCMDKNKNFCPLEIVVDFESAIHEGSKRIWPNINITGCRFHLAQSWFRNIQKMGLVKEYKDAESPTGEWLRLLFGLPFLHPNEVWRSFVDDFMPTEPGNEQIYQLTTYLDKTYMAEDSKFPPIMWASPSTDAERTTNACESFHSRFNENFTSSKPNIFIFVEVLKKFQTQIYISLNSVQLPRSINNTQYKKKKELLDMCLQQYAEKKISRFELLKKASYHYKKRTT